MTISSASPSRKAGSAQYLLRDTGTAVSASRSLLVGMRPKWKKAKPIQYPSFEEWKGMASQCDETAHLTAMERKARESRKLVAPDRLTEAATRYMDCEALAYWARQALERGSEPPAEVVRELERRCPGYLDARLKARVQESSGAAREWQRLMLWIAEHFFQERKERGLVRSPTHSSAKPSAGNSDYGIRRPLRRGLGVQNCHVLTPLSRTGAGMPILTLNSLLTDASSAP